MDYEKIKIKLLKIQEMMSEIPQDCKGNSEDARCNRRKYMAVKSMVSDLIEYL
jgi:hypothetical protein